jgi:hypothetical protein
MPAGEECGSKEAIGLEGEPPAAGPRLRMAGVNVRSAGAAGVLAVVLVAVMDKCLHVDVVEARRLEDLKFQEDVSL